MAKTTAGVIDPTVTVTLTANQIKALKGTPIELVPAPGAGYYINFLSATFTLDFGTTPYSGTGNQFVFAPALNDGEAGSQCPDSILAQSANCVGQAWGTTYFGAHGLLASIENQALIFTQNGADEYADGDGELTVVCQYTVVQI